MFLSGAFLGLSSFQSAPSIPYKRAYSKLKVYGNATIDKIQVKSTETDNTTLQNRIITDPLSWTPDTLLLAEFENNLSGGNISGITGSVTNWQVTRTDSSTSVLKTFNTLDVSKTSYIDYTTQANKKYTYNVFATNSTQISVPLQTSQVDTSNIYGWFLIGNDSDGTTYVYKLDLEVNSGSLTNEEDFVEYPSYTKYNSYAVGKRNFIKGSIQALAGDIQSDGSILQSVDYINTLRNRIQDISTKTLKNRKGEVWNVKTHNYSETQLNDAIGQQVYLVKFDFLQCADI